MTPKNKTKKPSSKLVSFNTGQTLTELLKLTKIRCLLNEPKPAQEASASQQLQNRWEQQTYPIRSPVIPFVSRLHHCRSGEGYPPIAARMTMRVMTPAANHKVTSSEAPMKKLAILLAKVF